MLLVSLKYGDPPCVFPPQRGRFLADLPFSWEHGIFAGFVWRGCGYWAGRPSEDSYNRQIRKLYFGLAALGSLFSSWFLVRRSNIISSSAVSKPQLSHWAYLPAISPTFFRKKFLPTILTTFFGKTFLVFFLGGKTMLCYYSFHTLRGRVGKTTSMVQLSRMY